MHLTHSKFAGRRTLLVCLLQLTFFAAKAQFAKTSATLPDASVVVLDTLFNRPDKPMPFDRHFTLKMSLPKAMTVKGYFVTPIDHFGKKAVRKRDYRLYMYSRNPDIKKRKREKKEVTWQSFKEPERLAGVIMTDFKTYPEGKRMGIALKIPPLDPNRDYQVKLVLADPSIDTKFDGLIDPLIGTLAGDNKINVLEYKELKKKYEALKPAYEAFAFSPLWEYIAGYSAGDVIKLKFDDTFNDAYNRYYSDKYQFEASVRFYMSTQPIDRDQADRLDSSQYFEIKTDQVPEQFPAGYVFASAFEQGIKDEVGVKVDMKSAINSTYYLSAMIHYNVKKLNGDLVLDKVVNFQQLPKVIFTRSAVPEELVWNSLPDQNTNGDKDALSKLKKLKENVLIENQGNCLDDDAVAILLKEAMRCPCEDKSIRSITDVNELTSLIGLFHHPVTDYIKDAVTGKILLKSPYKKENDDLQIQQNNITANIASLDVIEDFARKVLAATGYEPARSTLAKTVDCFRELRNEMQANQLKLKENIEQTKKFREKNAKTWQYAAINNVSNGSTQVIDFMTASKFRITPDFGLIMISNAPSRGLVQDVVPYLGFNINFRAVDKNIPMSEIVHKPWTYYFSFVGGVTLSSIKIDQKRDDLFSGKSLLTGFGFRLNNYLKFVGGVVWFKKFSQNPLSTEKTIAVSPYGGLSIDFELNELFGGINKLFK